MKQLVLTMADSIRLRGLSVVPDDTDTLPQVRSWQPNPVRSRRVEKLKQERDLMFEKIKAQEREHRADLRLLNDVMRVKQGLEPVAEAERMVGDLMRQVAANQDLKAENKRLHAQSEELEGLLALSQEESENLSIDAAAAHSSRNLSFLLSGCLLTLMVVLEVGRNYFWR